MTPEAFRSIRKAARLSQVDLAATLRISDRMVKYYEAGSNRIPGPVAVLMEMLAETLPTPTGDDHEGA